MGIFSSLMALFGNGDSDRGRHTTWHRPTVNIDGTPMVGDVDIHGNPYGVTDADSSGGYSSDWDSGSSFDASSSGGWDSFS